MRASPVLVLCCAGLAVAGPILVKKAVVTDVVTEFVYVTVYANGEPVPTAAPEVTRAHNRPYVSRPGVAPDVTAVVVPAAPAATSAAPVAAPTEPAAADPSPSPVVNNAAAASPTDYQSAVLYNHNIHRRNHQAPDLVYDDTLASYAATVASSCVFAHDLTPGGGGYGQNIADAGTTDANEKNKDPSDQVAGVISDMWYSGEVNLFPASDYGKPDPDMSNFHNWGHYSQVVWKSTTKVGCATHYCASGDGTLFSGAFSGWFTVCNYGTAGNMGGEYGTNVFPASS